MACRYEGRESMVNPDLRTIVIRRAGLPMTALGVLLLAACSTRPLGPLPVYSPDCDQSSCCPAGVTVEAGSSGDDRIWGGAAANCLIGGAGSDRLRGWCGDDILHCGSDEDRCGGGSGDDLVLGGSGDDRLRGGCGVDRLLGHDGDDHLCGGCGADELRGGRGDDHLKGGFGPDLIRPGPGRDRAEGRSGDDVFVIGAACEVESGDTVAGGRGFDRVRSPLSRGQLEALGVSFDSIEAWEVIAPLYDECVDVEAVWPAPKLPSGGLFVRAAALADGSFLTATGSSVFKTAENGMITPLGSGDLAYISPDGQRYALLTGSSLHLYDKDSTLLGTISGVSPFDYFKLVPGSNLVLAAHVAPSDDADQVESVSLLRPNGSSAADLVTNALQISRLTPQRIVYTTPTQLVARSHDGALLWSVAAKIHKLETAAGRTIAVPRYIPGRVTHMVEGAEVASHAVDGVVWNLAIAAGGSYSAATTRTRLYIFHDAELTASIPLPVASANTLDISDRGEVLIGGQDSAGDGVILLFHWQGNLLWQGQAGTDRSAYRPEVRFAAGGDRFMVLENRGLSAFDIERGP
jgi:hypothetical protein